MPIVDLFATFPDELKVIEAAGMLNSPASTDRQLSVATSPSHPIDKMTDKELEQLEQILLRSGK